MAYGAPIRRATAGGPRPAPRGSPRRPPPKPRAPPLSLPSLILILILAGKASALGLPPPPPPPVPPPPTTTTKTTKTNAAPRFPPRGAADPSLAAAPGTLRDVDRADDGSAAAERRCGRRDSAVESRRRALLRGLVASAAAATTAGRAPPPVFPSSSSSSSSLVASAAEPPSSAGGGVDDGERRERGFRSGAYGREELTNSIVASRDTNISPREVYDSIRSSYVRYPIDEMRKRSGERGGGDSWRIPRALDVGAGAGVSTQVLWDVGYRSIDAVDWSGSAWERFISDDPAGYCPPDVAFFELDDERYLDLWRREGRDKFDVIVFNFAVNESKARLFARELLCPENGRLLAPVNAQRDYWLKQTYRAYDAQGNVLWSATDVGAWSVQFQPDVTQDTCQGVWCAPFNGFQKKR